MPRLCGVTRHGSRKRSGRAPFRLPFRPRDVTATRQAWLDEQLHQGDMERVGQTLAAASVQLPVQPPVQLPVQPPVTNRDRQTDNLAERQTLAAASVQLPVPLPVQLPTGGQTDRGADSQTDSLAERHAASS